MERIASITRSTNETQISMTLNLDGSGRGNIRGGYPPPNPPLP